MSTAVSDYPAWRVSNYCVFHPSFRSGWFSRV